MKKVIQCCMLLFLYVSAHSQTKLFFTGAVSSDWNTIGNWSTTSGGTSSGNKPISTTRVVFDNNSPKCLININTTVKEILLESNFSDSLILLDSLTFTVSDTTLVKGGTINTGNSYVSLNKGLCIEGGNYIASKSNTTIRVFYKHTSGNFYHNNGILESGFTTTYYNSITAYTLYINNLPNYTSTLNINQGVVITAEKDLYFNNPSSTSIKNVIGPGHLAVKGDIYQAIPSGNSNISINTKIQLIGSANQFIYCNNDLQSTKCYLPKIDIDKPSGVAYISGSGSFVGAINILNGSLDASTYNSTVQLVGSMIFSSNVTFNNLILNSKLASAISISINQGYKLSVLKDLTYSVLPTSTASYINLNGPGTVELYGNLYTAQSGISIAGGGNALIKLVGYNNQTIVGNTLEGLGRLPSILVDKNAGKVELSKLLSINGSFEIFDDSGSALDSSKLVFFTDSINISTGPNFELYDVKMRSSVTPYMSGDVTYRNTFDFGTRCLWLSGHTLTINNSSPTALISTNTSSGIKASSNLFTDVVRWRTSNTAGVTYTIPLKTTIGTSINTCAIICDTPGITDGNPMYNVFSTYTTAADNLPYPPGVDSLLDTNGVNNVYSIVDRYYRIGYEGFLTQPYSTLKCRWHTTEIASPNNLSSVNVRAQIYDGNSISEPLGTLNMTTGIREIIISAYNFRDGLILLGDRFKPTRIIPKFTTQYFASLYKEYNSSYYDMKGTVNFIYREKYNDNNLDYVIYDWKRNKIIGSPGSFAANILPFSTVVSTNGCNYISINVSPFLTDNEYYFLEVTNDKNEKYVMRFKFKKSIF